MYLLHPNDNENTKCYNIVGNTVTSSGCRVPDRFRNYSVSEWDLHTPPGPLRNMASLVCLFNAMTSFLQQLQWNITIALLIV